MFSCPPVSLPCSWPCNLAHWTLWTWQPCVEQAIRFLQSLQRLPLPIIMNDFDSFPFDGKVMEPFASSGPLQIIVDLLWLKSGGWNALPAPPLALPCPPKRYPHGTLGSEEGSTEPFGLWNAGSNQVAHLLQDDGLLPRKANQQPVPRTWQLCSFCPPGPPSRVLGLNFPPKPGLTLLCMCPPGQPSPQETVPSSWPWSPLCLSDTLPQAGNNRPWGALRTEAPRRSYFQPRMFWPAAQALFRFLMFFRIFSLHHWEKHN